MGKKRASPWYWRLLAAALVVAAAGAGWGWWQLRHWTPPASEFPLQGVLIGAADGTPDFGSLQAIGANFVYLEASDGAKKRDGAFATNLEHLRGGSIRYGVVHRFDPCIPAELQAANFVTTVPRDGELLPPVIALEQTADHCTRRVSDAEVESELTTFLNQVEGHAAQTAILKLSSDFQKRYGIAARMERGLWVDGDWMQPDYAGRPWTLWTANTQFQTEASEGPLRWVVAQP